jgi:4,5-DOPA dioxygenase extradiol
MDNCCATNNNKSIWRPFIYRNRAISLLNMNSAPAMFISHGAPTFGLDPGLLGPKLFTQGLLAADAKAILIVSPHWQTQGISVMTTNRPQTVHDFGGFPDALYALQYTVEGAPEVGDRAAGLLNQAGFAVRLDARRGLDHGAWIPLLHFRPEADIPVLQVSMAHDLTAAGALRLGSALAPLRTEGVVIIGSGSLTHNLHEFRHAFHQPEPYAAEFARWAKAQVRAENLQGLLDYRAQAPHAARAHPTEEHFLPLLIAMGARLERDELEVLEGGITHGVLAMDSYVFAQAH